jgi:hypothetical protein
LRREDFRRGRNIRSIWLAVLKTNPDGAGIVQAIGPLKFVGDKDPNSFTPQRFLVVTDTKDSSQVVLRQSNQAENFDH